MKMQQKKFFLVFVVLLFIGIQLPLNMYGQVAIGSDGKAEKAALLQVKSKEPASPTSPTDPNNVTSDEGGIGLPRVELVDITTLEPFIPLGSTEWSAANQAVTKMKHAGLMVYNINVTPTDPTDPNYPTNKDKRLKQGVYVWDGEKWALAGDGQGKKWFYMPAFNLPLPRISADANDVLTFDLYAEYEWQFSKDGIDRGVTRPPYITNQTTSIDPHVPSPEADQLYTREELDFVVTYYDPDILTVKSILSADDSAVPPNKRGTMIYTVKDNDPGNTSFINVVFVIRD